MDTSHLGSTVPIIPDGSTTLPCPKTILYDLFPWRAEPHDVTSCHVELFTFSRQCFQHCLFHLIGHRYRGVETRSSDSGIAVAVWKRAIRPEN